MLNGKRVKKYKTVVQMSNLNPYWNTSFKIPVNPVDIQNIELHVSGLSTISIRTQTKIQFEIFRFMLTISINSAATILLVGYAFHSPIRPLRVNIEN